jgi:hypothetical protein
VDEPWTGGQFRGLASRAVDDLNHLAKVRVAGSNPVFRSKVAGQSRFVSYSLVIWHLRSGRIGWSSGSWMRSKQNGWCRGYERITPSA